MNENCTDCPYNVDDYCIMFDDVLGYENCIFRNAADVEGRGG